jgi:hypothetical protein
MIAANRNLVDTKLQDADIKKKYPEVDGLISCGYRM